MCASACGPQALSHANSHYSSNQGKKLLNTFTFWGEECGANAWQLGRQRHCPKAGGGGSSEDCSLREGRIGSTSPQLLSETRGAQQQPGWDIKESPAGAS